MSTDGMPMERPMDTIRVAAAGDIHCRESNREEITRAFAALSGQVDLVLLAGDLTTCGYPEEAAILADACERLSVPVVAVLGNHDLHAGRPEEVASTLERGGVQVLERATAVHEVSGHEIGIVASKGFVGGFGPSHLPDFGEPVLREVYAETSRDVEALDAGLREIANCPLRIVLLHYAPTVETLAGERRDIWVFLGTDRLAAPITEHQPDVVLHGHAHSGTLEGHIGEVPVYNVSVPVIGRDFWSLELSVPARDATPIR